MASLSLFELFGLSFARTGKNGDLIACASRKNFCSNCRESPQCRHKQTASRQALLGKDIRSGHWVKLACSGVAGTISNTKLKSGGHGFKLHRFRRCWLNHCMRQNTARKKVDGLPTMPSLVFEYKLLYSSYGKLFLVRFDRTVFRMHRQERWLDCTCLKKKLLFQLSWKSPVAAKANGF